MEHHIVATDSPFPYNNFEFPNAEFVNYKSTTPSEMAARIKDATIIIVATTQLSYNNIMHDCPKARYITSMGTGVDNVNHDAVRERGITLCNVPAQNIESVSEHAIALLMALKRRIVPAHAFVQDGTKWAGVPSTLNHFGGQVPRTNADEVVGIMGYGGIGTS